MIALLRLPHGIFRRHLSTVERVLAAAGLALFLYRLMVLLPAYPSPWETVAATAIFFVLLWSPTAGYFLAVSAALYPLYTLSLYLAVLFLSIALLGQRVFIHNLGATLLVVAAPWLAQAHLEWAVPLLGGLWWGKQGGAWIGGLSALWGLMLFGMTGAHPDWLANMGIVPQAGGLVERFGPANSLDTLKLLVTPLAANPTLLLYHLLQIVLWAMAGGLLGGMAERNWTQQKHPWRAIAAVFGLAALLLVGHLGFAAWLELYSADDFTWIIPGLFESALYGALLAAGLEALRDFIEHPLRSSRTAPEETAKAGPANSRMVRLTGRLRGLMKKPPNPAGQAAQIAPVEAADTGNGYPPLPVPEDLPRRETKKQRPDDIIKIELD